MLELAQRLRGRVRAREPLVGMFVKTPVHHNVELLALGGLDFAVLDAEHAPFDLDAIDRCILAGRAHGMAVVVRIPEGAHTFASACADMGAAAIVSPHMCDGAAARKSANAIRFAEGGRGLSPSPRAGSYGGIGLSEFVRRSDSVLGLWAQIEDAAALDRLDEIAAVEAVDCLFVGRVDLARSLGAESIAAPEVRRATERVIAAAAANGRASAVFVGSLDEVRSFHPLGASIFIVGSDQSMLRSQARALRDGFPSAVRA
ncbi:MAG TPA: aldolase/citrate lyase family protein [Rhizomicrobium sp.]